jgi:histone demethylase JARID1
MHKIVAEHGGYEEIWKNKKWTTVAKLLDLKDPGSGRILKYHYEKILYPFDVFKSGITIPNEVTIFFTVMVSSEF